MEIEYADPRVIHDNPYQALTTYNPDQVKLFVETFKQDADSGINFPANGHPYPVGRRLEDGTIQIADGTHRRDAFRALLEGGDLRFSQFPIELRAMTDDEMLETVIETVTNRKVNSPLAEARGYATLAEKGWTQSRIAKRFNKSQAMVSKALAVMKLPEKILQWLDAGQIPGVEGAFGLSHAYELLPLLDIMPHVLREYVIKDCEELLWNQVGWQKGSPKVLKSRPQIAGQVAGILSNECKELSDKYSFPYAASWTPNAEEGIVGKCEGCPLVKKVDGVEVCTSRKCRAAKLNQWNELDKQNQLKAAQEWATKHGIPVDKVVLQVRGYNYRELPNKLEPCGGDCTCIRVLHSSSKSSHPPIKDAPNFQVVCMKHDTRNAKLEAAGLPPEGGRYDPPMTPERAEKKARQQRVNNAINHLIESYVHRLTVPQSMMSESLGILADGLGVKIGKADATEAYRMMIAATLRKAAYRWNEWDHGEGIDALKLTGIIASHEREWNVTKTADGLTWLKVDPSLPCGVDGCNHSDSLWVAFTKEDNEPKDVRYLCGHHMITERQPGDYVPMPGHDTPIPTGIEAPAGHRVMYAVGISNKGSAHFVADGASETRCGQPIKRLHEGAQGATNYSVCPVCKTLAGTPIKSTNETEEADV